jgi:hypothetical protein
VWFLLLADFVIFVFPKRKNVQNTIINQIIIMTVQELKAAFAEAYGKQAEAVYFSPGRVNLIGEHVDYNGGSVFPCALSFGTYFCWQKTTRA